MNQFTKLLIILLGACSFFSCEKSFTITDPIQSGNFIATVDGTPWAATTSSLKAIIGNGMTILSGTSSDERAINITLQGEVISNYALAYRSFSNVTYLPQPADTAIGMSFLPNASTDTSIASGLVAVTDLYPLLTTISGTFEAMYFEHRTAHTILLQMGNPICIIN